MSGDRRERIVIVGTGAAGVRAAERLRELNFDGELVMISEEPYRPYHRPALSKQLITGAVRPRDIVLPIHTELDAIWRYATRATRLDPDEHIVHLPGGEEIRYDGLVIATGVQARHLPGAPRHDPRVQVLRTLSDAAGVQRAIARSRGAVVVIGGGFVGCELASAARELGRDATIIMRDMELLDRVPGPAVGEMVTALHRSHGVQLITETAVKHWVPRPDGMALHLSTGQVVVAACVVLGIGAVPTVDWLRGSGLILDDGVMCDATCHAVGARDIVVAGDVARWPNLRFDSMPRRVEHWLNAIEMGRAAAENLLVGQASARPFTPVPRFWSDQHGVRIQAAGIPALAEDTVPLSGSVMVGHRVTGYVSDGSLVGVVAWDSPRGMLRWTAELDRQSTTAMQRRKPARREVRVLHPSRPPMPVPPSGPPTTILPAVPAYPPMAALRAMSDPRPTTIMAAVSDDPPTEPIPVVPPAPPTEAIRVVSSAPPTEAIPVVPSAPPTAAIPAMSGVLPPPPPSRPVEPPPGPMDHPSFPRLRPVSTDHPSFPRMRPVSTDHPSFPRLRPVPPENPSGAPTTAIPPVPDYLPASWDDRSFPGRRPPFVDDHPSFPGGRPPFVDDHPSFPGRRPPFVDDHPSFPGGRPPFVDDHPSFPRMRPVSMGDHPSFPSMRPVPPPPPSRHDPRFAELFVPDSDLGGLRVPDLPPIDLRDPIR